MVETKRTRGIRRLTDRAASATGRRDGIPQQLRRGGAASIAEGSRWQRAAACRDTPTAVFFPAGSSQLTRADEEQAKAVCSPCPVRTRCLAFALEHGEAYGVWGGLNAEERRALKTSQPRTGDGPN
jgi:WhiB family redox-sensing transcriptional regulator